MIYYALWFDGIFVYGKHKIHFYSWHHSNRLLFTIFMRVNTTHGFLSDFQFRSWNQAFDIFMPIKQKRCMIWPNIISPDHWSLHWKERRHALWSESKSAKKCHMKFLQKNLFKTCWSLLIRLINHKETYETWNKWWMCVITLFPQNGRKCCVLVIGSFLFRLMRKFLCSINLYFPSVILTISNKTKFVSGYELRSTKLFFLLTRRHLFSVILVNIPFGNVFSLEILVALMFSDSMCIYNCSFNKHRVM